MLEEQANQAGRDSREQQEQDEISLLSGVRASPGGQAVHEGPPVGTKIDQKGDGSPQVKCHQ